MLHRAPGGGLGGHLRGERRRLPRALEPDLAGRGPGDHAASWIGDGHDGVVERALNVGVPVRDVLSFLAAHFLDAGSALWRHLLVNSGGDRSAEGTTSCRLSSS